MYARMNSVGDWLEVTSPWRTTSGERKSRRPPNRWIGWPSASRTTSSDATSPLIGATRVVAAGPSMLGHFASGICEYGAMRTSAVIRSQSFWAGDSVRLSATQTGAKPPTAPCMLLLEIGEAAGFGGVIRSTGRSGMGVIQPGSPRRESRKLGFAEATAFEAPSPCPLPEGEGNGSSLLLSARWPKPAGSNSAAIRSSIELASRPSALAARRAIVMARISPIERQAAIEFDAVMRGCQVLEECGRGKQEDRVVARERHCGTAIFEFGGGSQRVFPGAGFVKSLDEPAAAGDEMEIAVDCVVGIASRPSGV